MKRLTTLLFAAATTLADGCKAENNLRRATPIVDLGYAKYGGTYNATTGVTSFLGIRYAASPTGQYLSHLKMFNL